MFRIDFVFVRLGGLAAGAPLGVGLQNAMVAIRAECRPLFRCLPCTTDTLSTYRPRESTGKGKGKGKGRGKTQEPDDAGSDEDDTEDQVELKLVMVRYPWHRPTCVD